MRKNLHTKLENLRMALASAGQKFLNWFVDFCFIIIDWVWYKLRTQNEILCGCLFLFFFINWYFCMADTFLDSLGSVYCQRLHLLFAIGWIIESISILRKALELFDEDSPLCPKNQTPGRRTLQHFALFFYAFVIVFIIIIGAFIVKIWFPEDFDYKSNYYYLSTFWSMCEVCFVDFAFANVIVFRSFDKNLSLKRGLWRVVFLLSFDILIYAYLAWLPGRAIRLIVWTIFHYFLIFFFWCFYDIEDPYFRGYLIYNFLCTLFLINYLVMGVLFL